MKFTPSLLKGMFTALTLSLLAACQPGVQTPSPQTGSASSSGSNSMSSPRPSATASPQPRPTPTPRPASSLSEITSISIEATRTRFSAPGQQAQLQLVLLDKNGKSLSYPIQIEWASTRPEAFSIDSAGLVKALILDAKSEITAHLVGTSLVAHLELGFGTAETNVGRSNGSSGGGGGGGNTSSPDPSSNPSDDPSPDPSTDPSDDPSPDPSPDPSADPSDDPSPDPDPTSSPGDDDDDPAVIPAEFRVNDYTTDNQSAPAMAMDANGNFVVVWESFAQDGEGAGIYFQRFDNTGLALGDETRVTSRTNGNQSHPDIAMNEDGVFCIVWESDGYVDDKGKDVYLRFFSATGSGLGNERGLSAKDGDQSDPAVAARGDTFVFSWVSDGQDGKQDGVYGRVAALSGTIKPEFLVNQTTTGAQFAPDVDVDDEGNLVIAWTSNAQSGGNSFDVYARRFTDSGTANGGEFRVNTSTSDRQWVPSVAINDDGAFALAWHSKGQDGDADGVYARSYTSSGSALSGEIAVNSTTSGYQSNASLRLDGSGAFYVTWMSSDQDGDDAGVYYRSFSDSGSALSAETRANSITAGAQNYPALGLGSQLGICWASEGSDGDGFGIYARLFPLSAD